MGSHQSLSKGTSASESAKLCFIASEYAFFQRHFMVLVTHGKISDQENGLTGKVRGNYTSSSYHVNCRGYVRSREIFNFYEDVVSGATKERKALDLLMDDARKFFFDIVLVWKFDRFARSLKMLVDSLARCHLESCVTRER